jgi:GT2 family glycosyltransferase
LIDASVELGQVGFLASRVVGNDNLPLNVPTLDNKPLQNGSPRWIEHAEMGLLTLKSATFVSLLIPITIVNQVGLPIAEMFIWGDDIEYTTRITCHKPAYLVLKSCVVHARANQKNLSIATETNPERVKMFRYHYRNTTYISLKYKDYKLFNYHVISSIADIFKSIFKVHGIQKGKVIVLGLYHGLIMSYSKKY